LKEQIWTLKMEAEWPTGKLVYAGITRSHTPQVCKLNKHSSGNIKLAWYLCGKSTRSFGRRKQRVVVPALRQWQVWRRGKCKINLTCDVNITVLLHGKWPIERRRSKWK
jgi:hypothetical protein